MFFIPYWTDAPLYHWPRGTLALITLCLIAWTLRTSGIIADETWGLIHGEGLHPHQWITSNFLHIGFLHLLFNMIMLWPLGLIVEGKVGTGRFLALFLGIGIVECALEQSLTLRIEGPGDVERLLGFQASMGASSILYGLLAIAVLWAPQNQMRVFYWIGWRFGTFPITIFWLAIWFIAVECVWGLLGVGIWGVSSELLGFSSILHLLGFVVGGAAGWSMLHREWVDCEGWDLFSIRQGKHLEHLTREGRFKVAKPPSRTREVAIEETPGDRRRRLLAEQATSLELLRDYLRQGEVDLVMRIWEELSTSCERDGSDPPRLRRQEERRLIQLLIEADRWPEASPFVRDHVRRYPHESIDLELELAGFEIRDHRPSRGLKILDRLRPRSMGAANQQRLEELTREANDLVARGALEFDD